MRIARGRHPVTAVILTVLLLAVVWTLDGHTRVPRAESGHRLNATREALLTRAASPAPIPVLPTSRTTQVRY